MGTNTRQRSRIPDELQGGERREKRGMKPRWLRGEWVEEVHDGVPYRHAGRGVRAEVGG
jgi:hypothetical protein